MAPGKLTDTDRLFDAQEIIRKKNAEILDQRRTIEQIRRDNDTAEKIREELYGLSTHTYAPPAWISGKGGPPGSRGAPVAFWSDWHYGEVVDPDQVGGLNTFNKKVAKTRVQRLVDTTIDLCSNHMGKGGGKYPGIVVLLGGDMISGNIHEELLATNDRTPHQSVHDTIDLLGAGLNALANRFHHVFVIGVVGNHGRTTKKPALKDCVYTNYDWSIYCSLERDFRKDKRLRFFIPSELDAHFAVFGHRFLLTHGNELGVKGGDGIIGAIGPIMRGAIKVHSSEAQIGKDFDTLVLGHWHQYITLPRVIVNNSLKGIDEYSRNRLRAPYSRPSQALWFVHPEHGITEHRQVFVDEARTASSDRVWVQWHAHT